MWVPNQSRCGQVQPMVDPRVFTLDTIEAAFEATRDGKIVVELT